MWNDFGVCIRTEAVPVLEQFLPEFKEVFNYSIMYDCNLIPAIKMGVRVIHGRYTMCRPSSMADSYHTRQVVQVQLLVDVVYLALLLFHMEDAIIDSSDPHRVISSVFKSF